MRCLFGSRWRLLFCVADVDHQRTGSYTDLYQAAEKIMLERKY